MDRSLLERYFRGDVTDRECVEVADWVRGGKANYDEYMAVRRMYDALLVSDESEGVVTPKVVSVRRRWLSVGVAIAAAIAALVGLFGGVFNQSEQDQFIIHTVSSPVGQQTHTTLSDGTRVWLNSNSLIEVVKLSESERRIRLRGEAYLDVAKDASRPFVVETENMVVTVLGTEFNVNTYGKLQSVVLVNGKVQVTDRQEGTNYELTPGNRFEMDVETGDKTIRNVDTENFISWTNGYLKFESIPLKQVILQLQDYYGIVTTVTKEVDDSLLVSGKLELRKGLDKALESLCLISAVKYDWTAEDAITITGK
jgi:ferric-dicitrate binding protein FerR (iron transport regulator)